MIISCSPTPPWFLWLCSCVFTCKSFHFWGCASKILAQPQNLAEVLTLVHDTLVSPVNKETLTNNVHKPISSSAHFFFFCCIDLKYACVVSRFLWYVQGSGRLVCLLVKAESRRGNKFEADALSFEALCWDSKCLQQSERQLEHTSFSIITQQKLVWQPGS